MNTFRLSKNMPDTYVKHSRDFQLLCNSFDCLQGSTKYYIDSIININDTTLIPDNLLPLLQTKLGFFTSEEFSSSELRTVLQAFKYMVKNKGSRIGILQALTVFLKTSGLGRNSRIKVINKNNYNQPIYLVEIQIESEYLDTTLLTELLKYVIPTGYIVRYAFYNMQGMITNINEYDKHTQDNDNTIKILFTNTSDNDSIRITNIQDTTFTEENKVSTSGVTNYIE